MQANLASISQFLLLASWFAFAGLVFILALIARFYENLSSRTTYYRLYVIPVVALGLGVARYASVGRWAGDWIADLLMSFTGIVLLSLCFRLYQQMTARRK